LRHGGTGQHPDGDLRDLKASNAMILISIGDLVKASARDDGRFARTGARLEVPDQRIDNPPPA
jgi:hypothetical protein